MCSMSPTRKRAAGVAAETTEREGGFAAKIVRHIEATTRRRDRCAAPALCTAPSFSTAPAFTACARQKRERLAVELRLHIRAADAMRVSL